MWEEALRRGKHMCVSLVALSLTWALSQSVQNTSWQEESSRSLNVSSSDSVTVSSGFSPATTQKKIPHFYVDINKCKKRKPSFHFNASEGMVHGFVNRNTFTGTVEDCSFVVTVPEGLYVNAYSKLVLGDGRICQGIMFVRNPSSIALWGCSEAINDPRTSPFLTLRGNHLHVFIHDFTNDFWVYFKAVETDLRQSFNVVYESNLNGYITLHGFEEGFAYQLRLNISHTLQLPADHGVMVSFTKIDLYGTNTPLHECFVDAFYLYSVDNTNRTQTLEICGTRYIEPSVYDTSPRVQFRSSYMLHPTRHGFKMRFSFHPIYDIPQKLESGLFDCSGNYVTFRQHLDCNLRQECEGGEDETDHCPHSSPQCKGGIDLQGKCVTYKVLETGQKRSWTEARTLCQGDGGDLATFPAREDLIKVISIIRPMLRGECAFLGIQRADVSSANMYRKSFQWLDGSMVYYANFSTKVEKTTYLYRSVCVYLSIGENLLFHPVSCSHTYTCNTYLCESKFQPSKTLPERTVDFPVLNNEHILIRKGVSLVPCPGRHLTHDFLSCFPDSNCRAHRPVSHCELTVDSRVDPVSEASSTGRSAVTVEMFECHSSGGTVPYSLLCDFRHDCLDQSDETYCKHPTTGDGVRCLSGEYVKNNIKCDGISDCLDNSDESKAECNSGKKENIYDTISVLPPVIVDYDGRGNFTLVAMESDTDPCPVTHFRCPGQSVYCIPVFLRCNGIKDCPGGEDELNCADFTCPEFYRCRGSIVCLHPSHLCDGWPQCPQRDDELNCDLTCPSVCQCQGLSFVCPQPFPAHNFSNLRYLDAEGSAITPSALLHNFYLIYLSLADCGMDTWPASVFPNLQRLDLSYNMMRTLDSHNFSLLQNLRFLRLKGNPLTTLMARDSGRELESLVHLDLSHIYVTNFNGSDLADFSSLEVLDLSFGRVCRICEGFSRFEKLKHLDLRGCDMDDFPTDMYGGLQDLASIHASTFTMCCALLLPEHFNEKFCFAPEDEISSCDDLLRSNMYRVCLWIISILSMVGNSCSLVFRLVFQRRSIGKSGYNMFVTNLSVVDLVMGVFLAIVGTADQRYRGNYWWNKTAWKSSVTCKVAGFLSLLSSEVSAFMICFITLDRFIVLRFPFSSVRFKGRSAVIASGLAWLGGVLMAAVPLMPSLSHWRFYGQTGICIPLPVTRNSFQGRDYSFGVMIVFNFVLFVAIACGQAVIYWSIRVNSMASQDTTDNSRDLKVARRLITVVVSDFLCWFPIAVLGLLASNGVPVPGEVNVAMAIFVLPLNSALNPFLYTLNIVLEKRRKVKEERLRKFLLSSRAYADRA